MNTVAIVGRPNVGKSTLFNRLLKERKSIVDSAPGVTRDRVYGVMERDGIPVILIDTGGLKFSDDYLARMVRRQVDFALEEANVILQLVDGKEGLNPLDKEIADYIRKGESRKAFVINKMDKGADLNVFSEFSSVVLDETFQVSSLSGYGTKELLDWVIEGFESGEIIGHRTIGIIGKPNTGKSTFVNAVMGYERCIIREEPGTTRDSTNSYLEFNNENIVLVDTAGLKRRSRLKDSLEYYSFLRSIRTIEESDIVLILIDSTEEVSRQDKRIINWAIDRRTPLIILLTKFDLVPSSKKEAIKKYFKKLLPFIHWVPMIPVSSITMKGVEDSLLLSLKILDELGSKHPEIKDVIEKACSYRPPPTTRREVKISSVEYSKGTIWIHTNVPEAFDWDFKKYLVNRIRRDLSFKGIPINILAKR